MAIKASEKFINQISYYQLYDCLTYYISNLKNQKVEISKIDQEILTITKKFISKGMNQLNKELLNNNNGKGEDEEIETNNLKCINENKNDNSQSNLKEEIKSM